MKSIVLSKIKDNKIAIEFDNVLPELLFNKSIEKVENTIIYYGNKERILSDFFEVEVEGECDNPSDCIVMINGDLHRIKSIGLSMSCGKIIANGDVDFHVGAHMTGGHIKINGNAESYAGREMQGGILEITGNVKEFCGSSYAGEWRGMSGGKIIIGGNAGKQLADCMLNGEIHIKGDCDILAGIHMSGGFIQIDGKVNQWVGGQMKKGIILINGKVNQILPSFSLEEIVYHPFINGKYYVGKYYLYTGDKTVNGKGQLWIKA